MKHLFNIAKSPTACAVFAVSLNIASAAFAQTAAPATSAAAPAASMSTPDVLPADLARAQADPQFRLFAEMWKRAKADITDPLVGNYIGTYLQQTHWMRDGVRTPAVMPENRALAECVMNTRPELRPERARMVFEIDAKGMVRKAHTDLGAVHAALDFCITNRTTGHFVPTPPKAPLAYCAMFEKIDAKELSVSFCNDPVPATPAAASAAK